MNTTATVENLKLSSPWASYYHEIKALFKQDPQISIEYNEDTPEIKLYVNNPEKAAALTQLLPAEKIFGRVVLKITVIPANVAENDDIASVYEKAFAGNPAVSFVKTIPASIISMPVSYVVFKNEVVQFFNDELSDINGNRSTLYQEIAKDVFQDAAGIFFCTDTKENLGASKESWIDKEVEE